MLLAVLETKAGVPFGVSITVTRNNADVALSDAMIDRYFEEEGAIYFWIFQYMPIGRSYTLDLVVTPEQRLANLVVQRRARWLLARTDELFLE